MVNPGKREDALLDRLSEYRDINSILEDTNLALELRLKNGARRIVYWEKTYPDSAALCEDLRLAFGLNTEA